MATTRARRQKASLHKASRLCVPASPTVETARLFIWVCLLFDDGPPPCRIEPLLVFLDVKGPILIEVATEVNGSQLDDGLGHSLGPAQAPSTGPLAMGRPWARYWS